MKPPVRENIIGKAYLQAAARLQGAYDQAELGALLVGAQSCYKEK